jgi:hypothetical protein
MAGYCPCVEEGVCAAPAPADGGTGVFCSLSVGDRESKCPSREAMELARCTNPITIKITGQVLPK